MKKIYYIIILIAISKNIILANQNIAIIGTGYVGLVTGAIFSDFKNNVICTDLDIKKIEKLNNSELPIFEPGILDLIIKNKKINNISFTTNIDHAIQSAKIIFIAVGTPIKNDGAVDMSYIEDCAKKIAANLNNEKLIIIKSTVPIGTNSYLKQIIEKNLGKKINFEIISNPEFLREGSAVNDFLYKNPIVIGVNSDYAAEKIKIIYEPLIKNNLDLIITDPITAETIKYCWNTFSAIKIAYINEISNLCKKVDADIFTVIKGMAQSDNILPLKNIIPGPGIGGSCLPKDTKALLSMAKTLGIDLKILTAVIESNENHKELIIKRIKNYFDNKLENKTIAILGLSFKANTDDIRYSPAIDIISKLLNLNVKIKAYDPASNTHMQKLFPKIKYFDNWKEAVINSDLILILTEWEEFKNLDFDYITKVSTGKVIYDTRYIIKKEMFKNNKIIFIN